MAEKIVITSGKGGVGKSTVTVNLGIALARMGKRVCLVDGDFALNSLDVLTDCEQKISFDISDAVFNRCRAKQALIKTAVDKLYLLPMASYAEARAVSGQSLKRLLDDLSVYFDLFLVDCPSGIEQGFDRVVAACDNALVIINTSILSIRDADKVLSLLGGYGYNKIALLVNCYDKKSAKKNSCLTFGEIQTELKTPIIGVIDKSERLPNKNIDKISFFSREGKQFFALARAVSDFLKTNNKGVSGYEK